MRLADSAVQNLEGKLTVGAGTGGKGWSLTLTFPKQGASSSAEGEKFHSFATFLCRSRSASVTIR
jgi:hypothetical protein